MKKKETIRRLTEWDVKINRVFQGVEKEYYGFFTFNQRTIGGIQVVDTISLCCQYVQPSVQKRGLSVSYCSTCQEPIFNLGHLTDESLNRVKAEVGTKLRIFRDQFSSLYSLKQKMAYHMLDIVDLGKSKAVIYELQNRPKKE